MSNNQWWKNTILYEIYPASYKDSNGDGYGDIKGIISQLDYVKSLGIGGIWLTPVFRSPMHDNGYDVSDYYDINPMFGTMSDMEELIAESEKRNIKIILDLVVNHSSSESEWFIESSSSKNNPKKDWYIWRDPVNGKEPNNWRSIFGGSAWAWCENRKQYYLHTFAEAQPDLNWENPETRKAVYDIAKFWIKKGVSGFRIDAVTYIKKPLDFSNKKADGNDGLCDIHKYTANTNGILDFLKEFKNEVLTDDSIFTVAEANGVGLEELSQWVGDNGIFNMLFRFDLFNIQFSDGEIWSKTKEFKAKDIKQILCKEQLQTNAGLWNPIVFENHDQPRSVNHYFLSEGYYDYKAKALAMLLFTLRGTPVLYQGEELGMTNAKRNSINEYNDISSINQYCRALQNGLNEDEALECLYKYSRDNARTPMQWSSDVNAGFSSAEPWLKLNKNYININAEMESLDKGSVLSWYKLLANIRKKYHLFCNSKFEILEGFHEDIFAYRIINDQYKADIFVNLSDKAILCQNIEDSGIQIIDSYNHHEAGKLAPYEALCIIKNQAD